MEPWTGEPENLDELLDRYVVESKFSGRAPACTLYLVCAKNRSGDLHQALPSQRFKLFLAPWPQRWKTCRNVSFLTLVAQNLKKTAGPEYHQHRSWVHTFVSDCIAVVMTCCDLKVAHSAVTLSHLDFQIAHGPSKFVKGEKVTTLKRQERTGPPDLFGSRILEALNETNKPTFLPNCFLDAGFIIFIKLQIRFWNLSKPKTCCPMAHWLVRCWFWNPLDFGIVQGSTPGL